METFEDFHEHFTTHLNRHGIALKKMLNVQNNTLDDLHKSIQLLPEEQADQLRTATIRWLEVAMETAESLDSIKEDLSSMLTDYQNQLKEIVELNQKIKELAGKLLKVEEQKDAQH